MKRKFFALFLAATILLSLVPMTVLATGTTYAITNGTPETDSATNHGYITVDKETAAEGDAVTVTAVPDEGYQLKSLHVVSSAVTVADILPSDFPTTWNDGWQNQSNVDARLFTDEGKLVAKYPYEDYPNALIHLAVNSELTPENNNYSYTDDGIKWTFQINSGAFESVSISGVSTNTEVLNGTYSPVSQCIAAGTMISMPGDTQKAVEELKIGDVIRTFDHETGTVSSAPVCFIWESKNAMNAFTLTFEGNIEVTVIEEHGFYDREERKYVFINLQNAEDYIGHRFYHADTDSWLALESCKALTESVDAYAIITSGDLNHMSNGMLSMCDGSVKVFANIFEYDDQMKIDADKKKADIEAYGLTPKEKILELKGFTETDYDTYNLQYVDVMIGKGLITWEWLEALSDYCVENGLVDIYSGSEAAEEYAAPRYLLGSAPEPAPQEGIGMTANDDGTYTFTMPAYPVVITAEFEETHTHTFTGDYIEFDTINHKWAKKCECGEFDTANALTGVDAPTANTGLVYDNSEKTGVSEATGYTVTDGKKTAAGEYTATATLASGYIWSDGTTAAKEIKWSIAKATPYIKTNPEPTDILYGKKLADSTLVGGYAQVSGSGATQIPGMFTWTQPDTKPGLADSNVTLYSVTFAPADADNYNTVTCQVAITVTHAHHPVKVSGQAATVQSAGWKDYYECKDSEDACGALFEDAAGTVPIENLATWKAEGGNGYIAKLEEEPIAPPTGDTSNRILVVMLTALSSIALYASLVLVKKRKNDQ